MTSQSLPTTTLSKAELPAPTLPVDTFTEQLTHEPQRKAKLYSLPLIRTAIALITALWVVGVYATNPDGFWQAGTNNAFMVGIAGLTVAWAVGGWMTCLIRRSVGVAPPKCGGDVEVDSFTVPLAIRKESSGEWFELTNRRLVVSLEGDALDPGVAVIPLDLLEVSYDLLEGDSPRMEAHLSDIKYDTRYATWTLHLPASCTKHWKPIFADAKASERVATGREPKFDSKAVRTYTWKTEIEWDAPYSGALLTTIIGYAIATSLLAGWATSPQRSATESVLAGALFALIVLATSAGFTLGGYIGYRGKGKLVAVGGDKQTSGGATCLREHGGALSSIYGLNDAHVSKQSHVADVVPLQLRVGQYDVANVQGFKVEGLHGVSSFQEMI